MMSTLAGRQERKLWLVEGLQMPQFVIATKVTVRGIIVALRCGHATSRCAHLHVPRLCRLVSRPESSDGSNGQDIERQI